MNRFKIHGLLILMLLTSGCGNRAYYLRGGTVGVISKESKVKASVPDENGKLVDNVDMVLPAGTQFKYEESKK